MVWIHGGAYWFGGNFHPGYDLAHLVSHSITIDQPVVVVSINYRLGIGGFLASSQIKHDLARDGLSGVGNFGLRDQQTALEWVQQHISKFHGDPAQVTIFGESAGGISVSNQVAAAQPARFCRAVQMSGSLNLTANWPMERHQQRYDRLCKLVEWSNQNRHSLVPKIHGLLGIRIWAQFMGSVWPTNCLDPSTALLRSRAKLKINLH